MKRGDIVLAILPGDYGKARPCVIVQDDRLEKLDSVVLCPFTSDITHAIRLRVVVDPAPENGLNLSSEIMVEKLAAVSRTRCREVIGKVDAYTMQRVDERIALVTGLVD